MEKSVLDLAFAFTQVRSVYYQGEAIGYRGGLYNQNTELSFCAELYHQFRLIMSKDHSAYYRRTILQFDINKQLSDHNIKPDLVLHNGQNNRSNQNLYVEVKTNPESSLNEDLSKIITAVDGDLQFRNAVIIVVNRDLNVTINEIRSYIRLNECRNIKGLFLFHSSLRGRNPSYTISNIENVLR
ncbi:MAG: hypothetical protein ACLGGV_00310 [Bacteroidia bacterium]